MMKKRTPLLVGLLLIIGAFAFIYAFGRLDTGIGRDDAYPVYAVFDDATGLVENSRIMISGIPVGQITSIRLDPDDQTKARVWMLVDKKVKLYEGVLDPATGVWVNGATASRLQASLLGDYYIALTPGVAGEVIQPNGQIRNTVTESGLGAIMNQLEESSETIFPKLEKITDDISAITGSLRTAIGDEAGAAALRQIRDDVASTARNIATASGELREFMRSDIYPRGDDIKVIVDNVRDTTGSLRSSAGKVDRKLDRILNNVDTMTADLRRFIGEQTASGDERRPGTLAEVLNKADQNLATLQGSLDNVQSITRKIDAGEGTVGRLINDDRLVEGVEQVVEDIGDITSRISQLQVDLEFRSEYLFGQNALKHYINVRLRPRPDKYYFLQLVDDPRGRVRSSLRVTQTNDPTKPPVLVEDVTTTSDELKFTAQFAKRWHFLTFRYGIMESTGGWGVDLDLLEDALRFKLDVFQFGIERLPRVRILAAYDFAKNLYLAAGLDDILNGDSRDYFIGLGAHWTDSDIKAVLPFAPL